jgi:NitT/TauT family transport system substrate-binding protein
MKYILLGFQILLFSATQLSASDKKLTFSPHWLPQAQFAGYYVALEQGFYAEEGLQVEITHPSASTNVIDFLTTGKADIVSQFLVSAMSAHDKGVSLVNIAQTSQRSAILFVSKKTSGIENIQDLNGKKVGIWRGGFSEIPQAMVKSNNIQVEWVPILSSVNLFLLDGVDAMTVMWYNEFNQIHLSGFDSDKLNTFFMSDYGFDVPEDGLYSLEKTRSERSEDLEAFVRASRKGWEYAARNRSYAVELVIKQMQKTKVPANKAQQSWMLDRVLELKFPQGDTKKIYHLEENVFNQTNDILRNLGFIKSNIQYPSFFKPVIE